MPDTPIYNTRIHYSNTSPEEHLLSKLNAALATASVREGVTRMLTQERGARRGFFVMGLDQSESVRILRRASDEDEEGDDGDTDYTLVQAFEEASNQVQGIFPDAWDNGFFSSRLGALRALGSWRDVNRDKVSYIDTNKFHVVSVVATTLWSASINSEADELRDRILNQLHPKLHAVFEKYEALLKGSAK